MAKSLWSIDLQFVLRPEDLQLAFEGRNHRSARRDNTDLSATAQDGIWHSLRPGALSLDNNRPA
jgi:hypothetical protein